MFLKETIIGKPRSGVFIDWNTLFTMPDGTSAKLGKILEQFREEILRDLIHIKFSKLSSTAVQNEFVRIPSSNIFIYQHKEYMQAHNVEIQNFVRACQDEITEESVPVFQCSVEESGHDDDLLPFFHSNPQLCEIYRFIGSRNEEPPQRKATIKRYLDCVTYMETNMGEFIDVNDNKRFHADNNKYHYTEDTWSKRLFEAVASRYPEHDIDYTATLRGNSCNQAILRRMPKGTPLESLMFHGSPDIIINYKPIMVQEVQFGCIETKKNLTASYSSSSMMPQQAGQAICYIYQLLIAKILNKIIRKVDITSDTGYGLYVLRESGTCILYKVILSGNPLSISATEYYGVGGKVAVLCTALNVLASCHKE